MEGLNLNKKKVELIKALPDRKTTIKAHAELLGSDDFLGKGKEGSVTRVTVPIKEKISNGLAYKEFYSELRAVDALKAWIHLKKINIPVPKTFRLVKEGERYAGILMTDLTHNWRDILISSNPTKMDVIKQVYAHNPDTVRKFAALDIDDAEVVRSIDDQVVSIAEKTAEAGIKFSSGDVISAVFDHEGQLELIISDMGNIELDSLSSPEDILNNNQRVADLVKLFISEANKIAVNLIKTRPQ